MKFTAWLENRKSINAECFELEFISHEFVFALLEIKLGQFIVLSAVIQGAAQYRSYSVIEFDLVNGRLKIAVRYRETGLFSKYLATEMQYDDSIEILGPFGNFLEAWNFGKKTLYIAGGIGITPFLSLIRQNDKKTLAGIGQHDLVFAVRSMDSAPYIEELLRWKTESGWAGNMIIHSGDEKEMGVFPRITDIHIEEYVNKQTYDAIYVCGPETLMERVQSVCLKLAIPPPFTESFRYLSSTAIAQEERTVHIEFDGKELVGRTNETILTTFLNNNVPISYACGIGVCQQCACTLRTGQTKSAGLTDPPESGMILACSTFPLSDLSIESTGGNSR